MLARIRARMVARFWARAFRAGGISTWMAEPLVRAYINTNVTGEPGQWPIEWLAAEWLHHKPFPRAVSEYREADLSTFSLPPRSFEAAFFHQSLHHVAGLEHCLDQVVNALVPEGLLYLDEYVGPSRTEWRKGDLAAAQAVFSELPRALRRGSRLQAPVDWRDPSEAIRSSEILPTVTDRFEILRRRDYGGNLLALIYPLLRLDHLSQETRDGLIAHLIAAERSLLAEGAASYCTVVIARPRAQRSRSEV
jgi:SAM-dependent methyltransferase